MSKLPFPALALLAATCASATAATFADAPILPGAGIDTFNRSVTREHVGKDLFSAPWATAVIGRVDVYDGFPYLEARWFQVVSDPEWHRLVYGEIGGRLTAWDAGLDEPRGLSTDERGRVYVADSGRREIAVFATTTEFDHLTLAPLFEIGDLARPYGVAFSDRGTPFDASDDRLYVADTGLNRVVAYDLSEAGASFAFEIGTLGNGRGEFAGPLAVTVGRADGAHTADVYVADSHNGRIVRLSDAGDRFDWKSHVAHAGGAVTSLDADHWGNVYAASPEAGVVKYSRELAPLAQLAAGVDRARAFHVPFVNRTDHRNGETRRVGQGAGLLVEEWSDAAGIRLVKLGVEMFDLAVVASEDIRATFTLTDRADLVTEILDASTGRTVHREEWGAKDAGSVELALDPSHLSELLVDGAYIWRARASSPYPDTPPAETQKTFEWAGGPAGTLGQSARVLGNEPNPFRSSTSIRFVIPNGGVDRYDLRVFDVAGRVVRVLGEGSIGAGVHERTWDGRDSSGADASSGIYFYQLVAGGEVSTGKMVFLR
jgi:hypothetical protein